jgi:hypothetical protein
LNNQNLYHDIKEITSVSPSLPVSVASMKDYMRLEGFVDEDESTTSLLSSFDYDDTLITDMIWAAVKKIEKYCGISLVSRIYKDCVSNGAGDIELRYGPVTEINSITYKDGTEIDEDSYETTGFDFLTLDTVFTDKIIINYDTGYTDLPEELELGIKQCVAYWYTNREDGSIPELALNTVLPFKRSWTWLA